MTAVKGKTVSGTGDTCNPNSGYPLFFSARQKRKILLDRCGELHQKRSEKGKPFERTGRKARGLRRRR